MTQQASVEVPRSTAVLLEVAAVLAQDSENIEAASWIIERSIRKAEGIMKERAAAMALKKGAARLAYYDGLLAELKPGDKGDNLAGVAANACAEEIAVAIRALE